MSRIVLKSANTAVILGESPAFKTVDESGSLFAGVKSASFGFSTNRQKVQAIGDKNLAVDDLIRNPDVDLSLSYTYSPTYANEDLIGLNFTLDEKSEFTLLSTLKDKSYNFYFYNNPEQGQDGIQSIQDQIYSPGGEIISFGNAHLSSYALDFQVGSIPEVSVSFQCSNVESEEYFGTNTKSPAINLESGNNAGVGDFDITKTTIVESKVFGEVYDLDRSKLATPTPSELEFTLKDMEIGGQKISPNNHILNSFKFQMNVDRASYYKLGSNYACGRDIKYPVQASVSISSLVDKYENGFVSGLIQGDELNFLEIVATDCSGIITSKLYFENLKVEKVQYDMLVNESMNYSLDLSLQINDEEGFKAYVTEEEWKATRVYDISGAISDFTFGDVPVGWKDFDTSIYGIRFADFESYSVGSEAFLGCENVSGRLFIPRNVNYIGDRAFEGCSSLQELFFDTDHRIDEIGASGFKDCFGLSLETLLFPKSLDIIGESCFEGCYGLNRISLNEVSTVGDKAFMDCSGLIGPLTLREGLTYLGSSSFENCVKLNGSIEFPDTLTQINEKAFKNCISLQGDLEINNSITSIGAQAFYNCSGIDGELNLSENLTYIESGTFYNCSSINQDLNLPEGITGVGEYAFYNLNVNYLDLPSTLLHIHEGAFERLNDIKTDLELPENIVSIGDRAFAECDSFEERLYIPSGISSIGEHAFSGCIGIEDVYINSPTSIFQGDNAFDGVQGCLFVTPRYYNSYISQLVDGKFQGMPVCLGSRETIVFDAQSFDVVKVKRGDIPTDWYSNKTDQAILVIGDTCRKIEDGAFTDSSGLVGGLVIPSGVNYVGADSFRNCSFSGDLILDDNITGIGSGAFEGCSGFDGNLQIPYYLDILYEATFKNCTGFQSSIVLPPRVTRIEDSVFENCSSLNGTISLPAQCEYIGFNSFDNCSSLSGGLVFPQTLTGIGGAAFRNCSSLDGEVEFNPDLEYIGDSGFYNCSTLSGDLSLPTALVYLGEYAFYNCFGFTGVLTIPETLSGIETSTFENCSGFSGDLVIPKEASGIGDRAFYNCTGFETAVVITDIAAQNIGTDAFTNTNFTILVVHDNVEDISIGEFDYFKTDPLQLILQDGLISVSDFAFKDYAFSGDFSLPFTVQNIGVSAFESVAFNGEYDFSSSLITGIGSRAFYDCSGISGSLIFSDDLVNIGSEAFRDNTSVNGTLSLPPNITGIGEFAFANISSMSGSIILPNTLSGLGQYAFLDCSSLDGAIQISRNPFLTTIETGTFKNCSSIQGDLTIPDNITNVEYQAFKNCSSLSGTITLTDVAALSLIGKDALDESIFEHIVVSDFVEEISNGEFDYFQNLAASLTLSENLTGILNDSFDNYAITGAIIFPSGLLEIQNNAFKFCDGLESGLVFPESLTLIGDSSFEGCSSLSGDVSLPINLPNLGARSFYNCVGLDGILTISDLTASSVSLLDDTFFGTSFYMLRVESVDGEIDNEDFDVFAQDFTGSLDLGQSVSSVNQDSFDGYSFLGDFFSSGSIATLGARSFSGVQFSGSYNPDYVIEIGNDAFRDCGFNQDILIFSSTETIGDRAFLNCDTLIGDLKITETVITIGDYAFFNCTGLNGEFILSDIQEEIEDPATFNTELTSVGSYSFAGLTGLSGNLIIPGSVLSIGEHAFDGNTGLDGYLYLGSGLTEIKDSSFKDCSNLSGYNNGLIIPYAVNNIRQDAFNGCSSLEGTLSITKTAANNTETDAFLNTNFDSITVLSGATFISDGDFDYFQQTGVSLTLNDDLIQINNNAFDYFSFVGSLSIPDLVTDIGDEAFRGVSSFNGGLLLNVQTENIGNFAFSGCGFGSLIFQSPLTNLLDYIGSGAFKDCDSFSNELILPEGLQTIKSGAFQGCSNFDNVDFVIPGSINSIGEHAFSGCSGMSGVFIESLAPDIFEEEFGEAFRGISGYLSLGVLVYNDYKAKSTQIGDDFWYQGMPISGVGATESIFYTGSSNNILNREIQDSIDVTDDDEGQPYTIPVNWKNTVSSNRPPVDDPLLSTAYLDCWFSLGALCEVIGQNAFRQRYGLRGSLDLGGDLRIIDDEAFYYCFNVESLSLGNRVEEIGEGAFRLCSSINGNVVFPNSLTGIEDNCFRDCSSIQSFNFTNCSLDNIADYAFAGCTSNNSIILNDGLTGIGAHAFSSNTSASVLDLPDTVTSIKNNAFKLVTNISSLVLPPNLDTLGYSAFEDCISIDGNVEFPASLTYLDVNVFEGCSSLQSITLNGQYVFYKDCFNGCSSLTGDQNGNGSLTIPSEVVTNNGAIYASCFKSCGEINRVVFPNNFSGVNQSGTSSANTTTINEGYFEDCTGLLSVSFGAGIDFIRDSMFDGCTGLTTIEAPNLLSLTGLGDQSFKGTNLDDIYIPENLISIGASCFANCKSLNLTFEPSGNLREIKNSAFLSSQITNLVLPDVDYISGYSLGTSAFSNCDNITTANLPNAVSGMGTSVFNGCDNLESFTWPSGIDFIPNSTFTSCSIQPTIDIPNWVTGVGNSAFQSNQEASGVLFIKEKIEYIGNNAFDNTAIESVVFNNTGALDLRSLTFASTSNLSGTVVLNNVRNLIGPRVFESSAVNNIVWNDTNYVNRITSFSFKGAYELSGIELPTGLSGSIAGSAFMNTYSLTGIDFSNTKATSLGKNCFTSSDLSSGIDLDNGEMISLGSSCFTTSKIKDISIPQPISSMAYACFQSCYDLRDVDFTTTQLTSIPDNCFQNSFITTEANSITLNNEINSIGTRAFFGSHISGVVDFSNTAINSLGTFAFYDTDLMSGIKFPNSLTDIPQQGFEFSNLTWFSGDGVTSIQNAAFRDCDNFSGFIGAPNGLPESLKVIKSECFLRSDVLKPRQNYLISGNIDEIGNNNWSYQSSTQSLIMDESFSGTIGNSNWVNVVNMSRIDILFDNTDVTIGSNNWLGCNIISDIYINCPYSVWVGTNNFANSSNATINIKDTYYNDYINNGWSGQQGVDNGATLQSYTPV